MVNLFLKNTSTKWQSNLMDLNSAYHLLSPQTLDQLKNWSVFLEDGKDQWINVLDCPAVLNLFKPGPAAPKAAVEAEEVKTEAIEIPKEFFNPEKHEPVSIEQLNQGMAAVTEIEEPVTVANARLLTPEEYGEKRQHPRFNIRLRVIIKSGKNTFLTYTSDVSLGGLSLINDVPEYIFNSEAEIYITAPDQKNNIMLICSPVASKLGRSRLMFRKIDQSKLDVLATWLHHVVKPNAKITQSS